MQTAWHGLYFCFGESLSWGLPVAETVPVLDNFRESDRLDEKPGATPQGSEYEIDHHLWNAVIDVTVFVDADCHFLIENRHHLDA